jgi:hypothetical protein
MSETPRTIIRRLQQQPKPIDHHNNYNALPDLSAEELQQEKKLSQLLEDISSLGPQSHAMLYKKIRSYKQPNFFVVNNSGTHFNRSSLTPSMMLELYQLVKLCKADEKRQNVIDNCKNQHDEIMDATNERIRSSAEKVPVSLSAFDDSVRNPSETEKLNKMLKDNNH